MAPHVQARLTSAKRRVIEPLHFEITSTTMTDVWSGEILLPDGESIKGNDASLLSLTVLIPDRHWLVDSSRHLCTGDNHTVSTLPLDRRQCKNTLISRRRAQL
jgi:hypothetical protein